ncbi:MAG: Ig-like domain-containing protein [Patescibacteria group bacterium]
MKKEKARSLRRTVIFSGLTILFVLGLIFWGIPSLIKIAIFFSEIKSSSTPVEQSDILPPAPPKINPLPEATNIGVMSLSGFAEAGSTVEVFLNNSSYQKVITSEDGTFLADNLNLTEGQNEIYATAQDNAGNKSQPSAKMIIVFDKTPPELTIDKPQDKAHFIGEKQRKIQISGKTDPGTILTINEHLEVLDKDGNFSLSFTLSEGENVLKFIATDQAGNKTEKEIKVTFTP